MLQFPYFRRYGVFGCFQLGKWFSSLMCILVKFLSIFFIGVGLFGSFSIVVAVQDASSFHSVAFLSPLSFYISCILVLNRLLRYLGNRDFQDIFHTIESYLSMKFSVEFFDDYAATSYITDHVKLRKLQINATSTQAGVSITNANLTFFYATVH